MTTMSNKPKVTRENDQLQLSPEVQAVLDSSYDGIFITDGDGRVIWANPASADICGIPRDELIGKDVSVLEKQGVFNPSITLRVLRERRSITYYQDTGSGRKVLVTGSPVFDEQGRIVRVICNSRDITELLSLREQLESAELKAKRYQSELEALKKHSGLPKNTVFESHAMKKLYAMAIRIAPKDVSVLILGESGVGKNALARTIHDASNRRSGPFIEINCGAIPETLFESELFGYEPGAFTSARREGKKGLLELAHKGTLFLNEIGEMPAAMQVKLLTFLQEGALTRVGGTKPVHLDVRIIAATNRNLEEMIDEGEFREDLYYRLNVVSFTIPPLRERADDILAQSQFFLEQFNEKYDSEKQLSAGALQSLLLHRWPGNTRELRNAIERAVVISENSVIEASDLNLTRREEEPAIMPFRKAVEQFEKELISRAFKIYGSTHKVAAALDISQPTIVRKAKKYHIDEKLH